MKSLYLLLATAFTGSTLGQGPLTPPPGADPSIGPVNALTPGGLPQPTMKTLHQVEPRTPLNAGSPGVTQNPNGGFTISAPGSYYLTGNLTIATDIGIVIASSQVTLDLNGFCISTDATGVIGNAIEISIQTAQITIKNGCIKSGTTQTGDTKGFAAGVAATQHSSNSPFPRKVVISGLQVSGCAGFGISGGSNISSGMQANVDHCSAEHCGLIGIAGESIVECTADRNRSRGLFADSGLLGGAGQISGSSARSNGDIGIYGNLVVNCTAANNTASGILGESVQNCVSTQNNQHGIVGASVIGCTAYANHLNGIKGEGGTVSDCTAKFNGADSLAGDFDGAGISAPYGLVKGCNTIGNTQNGIYAPGGFVTLCRSSGNGANWSHIFVNASQGYSAGLATNNF